MSSQLDAKWPEVRLGDHARVKARLGWKGLKAHEYVLDGPIFLAAPNLRGCRIDFDQVDHLPQWRYDESPEIQLVVGDVLLVKDGSTLGMSGIVKALPALTTVNGSIAVIRPGASLASGFLFYSINGQEFQRLIWLRRAGLGVPHLFQADLREFRISLPSLAEQHKIAEILSTLDDTIEQTEALIAKYRQIKAGLMQDLFTRGVCPDGRLRPARSQAPDLYKESPLGWMPKDWDLVQIGECFDIQLGKMLSQLAKTGRNEAPYLGNRNVQWNRIDTSNLETMDFNVAERQKFRLLPGDLLVCEGGDVGRTAIWSGEIEDCFYQKAVHRLRPKALDVLPSYMLCFMRFARDHGYFREFTSQSSIAHLTQEKLAKVGMLKPSRAEQVLIAARFDAVDEVLLGEQDLLANLRLQKLGLMNDLLTGRVRVNATESEEASA